MTQSYYRLEKLTLHQLPDLAKFVVTENFKHHSNETYPLGHEDEINAVFQEELNYFENAQSYVAKDANGFVMGSIRVLQWNGLDLLPIQKLFGMAVTLRNGFGSTSTVWHIGRFAIRKGVGDVNLFKQLMVCAIAPVCQNPNAVAYAECDSKLLRTLLALGIKAQPMGQPVNYLGSETVPVKMPYAGLINFYTRHQHLAPKELSTLLQRNSKNYTFG